MSDTSRMTPEQQAAFDMAMKECTGNRYDFERLFLAGFAAHDTEVARLREIVGMIHANYRDRLPLRVSNELYDALAQPKESQT